VGRRDPRGTGVLIPLVRSGLRPTRSLRNGQAALDATTNGAAAGLAAVSAVGAARKWASMRGQLARAQYQKCAYCEDYLSERAHEVDHIRPKSPNEYWWLAFRVPNLVLACRTCNNFKGDDWALQRGVRKLKPREEPWSTSEPAMLVDPTVDDPNRHLTYVYAGDRWRIAPLSDRGLWTITALELDRDSFTRRANEWIREAVDPRVASYAAAVATRDTPALRKVVRDLLRFSRPTHRWSQLAAVLLYEIRAGTYRSPRY
jgi:uncharacterized protein (TIGR02646 family)